MSRKKSNKAWEPTTAYGIRVPTGFFIFHGHDPRVDYHCGNNGYIIPVSEAHEKQLEKFRKNQSADFKVETTPVYLREQTPDGVNHWAWERPVESEPNDEALRDAEDAAGAASAVEMTEMATATPPEATAKTAKGKKGGR